MKKLYCCKDFVFFHEIHHLRYQSCFEEKVNDFHRVIDVCLKLKDSSLPQETKDAINKLLEMSDKSIFGELCCDINSICCITYLYSGGHRYDKKIAEEVIKSVRLISLFINDLKKIDLVYKKRCETDDYKLIETFILDDNYVEIEFRNYILYFISAYLMGFSNLNTDLDFFVKDECFYKYYKPYSDILSVDFITSVFAEENLYSGLFTQRECGIARDIIIGWHKGLQNNSTFQ